MTQPRIGIEAPTMVLPEGRVDDPVWRAKVKAMFDVDSMPELPGPAWNEYERRVRAHVAAGGAEPMYDGPVSDFDYSRFDDPRYNDDKRPIEQRFTAEGHYIDFLTGEIIDPR